ncbi:MAG: hypothetical protein ACLTX3_06595 [Lachnospiraceae bacterium]
MAEEKHVPAVLSDDFCERYLDMDNMKVLEQRTIDGIAAYTVKSRYDRARDPAMEPNHPK